MSEKDRTYRNQPSHRRPGREIVAALVSSPLYFSLPPAERADLIQRLLRIWKKKGI